MTRLLLLLTLTSFKCFGQINQEEVNPREATSQAVATFQNLIRPGYSNIDSYRKLKLTIKGLFSDTTKVVTETVELTTPNLPRTEKYKTYICDTLRQLGKKCYETTDQFNEFVLVDLFLLNDGKVSLAGDTVKAKKTYSDQSVTKIDYIFNSNGLPVEKIAYYGRYEKDLKQTGRTIYLYNENKLTARIDTTYDRPDISPIRVKRITERYFNNRQLPEKIISKEFNYYYANNPTTVISKSEFRYDNEGRLVYFDDKTNNNGMSLTAAYKSDHITVKTYFNDFKGVEYNYELLK